VKKQINIIFSLFLFLFCCIGAAEDAKYGAIMRQAAVDEEAGLLDDAIAVYQELLKGELTSDQQNFLLYDIGTLYLEKQDYDKAIEVFSGIPNEGQSPLLISRLNRNLGIAYYSKAMQIIDRQTKTLEDIKEIIYELRSALASFAKESEAFCEMHNNDQAPCQPSQSLLQLQNTVKIEIASLQDTIINQGAADLPLEEEIPWLYDSLNDLIIEIDFIDNFQMDPSEKSEYLKMFVSEQPSWQPLWNASESKLHQIEKNEENLKADRLFVLAKEQYNLGIQNLSSGQLAPARQAFTDSKHQFSELMKILYEQDPLRLNLYRILGMYQRLAQNTALTEAQLANIKEGYSQLHESVSPAFKELLKERDVIEATLKSSQEHLESSMAAIKEHKHSAAYLYFLSAMSEVQDALFDLQKASPGRMLERILFLQNFALKLNGRILQLPAEEISPEILKLPIEAQKKTLMAVATFWKILKKYQVQKFQEEGLCQSSPWGTTLPLFEKGSQFAQEAMSQLNASPPNAAKALTAQTNAVNAWENAVAEMKHPHEDPRSGCHQGPSSAAPSDQKIEAPQNQLLQSLQQMYLDDQSQKKEQPAVKMGDRPW